MATVVKEEMVTIKGMTETRFAGDKTDCSEKGWYRKKERLKLAEDCRGRGDCGYRRNSSKS